MKYNKLNISDLPVKVVDEIEMVSRIAGYLWEREWAERNAGNISIDLTDYFNGYKIPQGAIIPYQFPEAVANKVFFVTGTGCYLRSLVDRIAAVSCIMQVNADASGYTIFWGGLEPGFRPTSELISHIKIHNANAQERPHCKAVVHTHPSELIVLSHHPIFKDEDKTNHSLWKMCPEVRVFVPDGVACTRYALSGSEELADLTVDALKQRNVVLWEKHGALATGENVEKAFDYLDVANKGAKLLLMAWSANFDPVGLSEDQLKELEIFI